MRTFATLIDNVQSFNQDNSTIYTDAIVTVALENAIREFSEYFPRIVKYTYKLENRTGTTSSYLNTWLMDTTSDQFVPVFDVGKIIHNTTTGKPNDWAASTAYTKGARVSPTSANGRRYICSVAGTSDTSEPTWPTGIDETVADNTATWMHRGFITEPAWAKVLSSGSNSGTQLNLSKDIMADDESYEMFNKDCWSNRQIYLGDIPDDIGANHGVIAVEYKTQRTDREYRNFTVEGDILTLDIESSPPSNLYEDLEVFVWMQRKQQVTQQSITTVYVDLGAGYAAGTTSIVVDYDGGTVTGTIVAGTNFTIVGTRGNYILKADATFSANHATLQIFPGLENNVADDATIYLLKSSLDDTGERLVVELAAAKVGISKSINTVTIGGVATVRDYRDQLAIVLSKLERMRNRQAPRTKRTYLRD